MIRLVHKLNQVLVVHFDGVKVCEVKHSTICLHHAVPIEHQVEDLAALTQLVVQLGRLFGPIDLSLEVIVLEQVGERCSQFCVECVELSAVLE